MRPSPRENGQAGRFRIVSAVAATFLALALAAPVGAETNEPPAAVPAPATEDPAATEETQPAAAEEVEEAPAPSTPPEPAEAAASPAAAPPASSAIAPPPAAAPAPVSEESVPAAPVESRAATETVQESAGALVGRRASELVERARQDPASVAAPAVEGAAQTLRSQAPLETAQSTVLAVGHVATPAVERTVPSQSAPAGFDPPASAARGASAAGHELGGPPAGERTPGLRKHVLAKHSGAFERIGSEAPHVPAHSAGSWLAGMTAAADPDRGRFTTGQPNGSRPDRPAPAPPPESPGVASGSGGSFFVPLAALLALLALAAPATFRRPREALDFLAPTPFVCALERPG